MSEPRHVIFGTSSWGLGHATRDLVLLRALLEAGCRVTVVATGPAMRVLRGELGESCEYLDWVDMPSTIAHTTAGFYFKTVTFIPRILGTWFAEKRRLARLLKERRVDVVVSDHRYGMATDAVPCYFITHSPRYIAPWRSWFMEASMEWFVARWLRPVRKVLIPDEEGRGARGEEPAPSLADSLRSGVGGERKGGLSGDMSHRTRFLPVEKCVFLGFLSSVERDEEAVEDVDVFISISGPEPQRTRLQEAIFAQLDQVEGKIVVALGLPGASMASEIPLSLRRGRLGGGSERTKISHVGEKTRIVRPSPSPSLRREGGKSESSNVEVHAYLDRAAQQAMMNRSRLVVCRSGYTTLMELAELGKKALLIPTPAQTEQLYLADTLRERGLFHSVRQHKLSLARDIEIAKGFPGYRATHGPEASAKKFLETVLGEV